MHASYMLADVYVAHMQIVNRRTSTTAAIELTEIREISNHAHATHTHTGARVCSLTPLVRPSFDGRLTHIAECNWLKCAVACNSTVHMHVQCVSGTHSEWSAVRLLLCYTFFLTLRWERSGFFFLSSTLD